MKDFVRCGLLFLGTACFSSIGLLSLAAYGPIEEPLGQDSPFEGGYELAIARPMGELSPEPIPCYRGKVILTVIPRLRVEAVGQPVKVAYGIRVSTRSGSDCGDARFEPFLSQMGQPFELQPGQAVNQPVTEILNLPPGRYQIQVVLIGIGQSKLDRAGRVVSDPIGETLAADSAEFVVHR